MKIILKITCFLSILLSCNKSDSITENIVDSTHLKYFGFTLIDVFWDDPLDTENKTNYLDEVANFSNMADILVLNPSDHIISRVEFMNASHVKAILHLHELFFENVGSGGPSGILFELRADYKERWNTFIQTNNLVLDQSKILALYLGEEPTWNSISFSELKAASDYIKSTLPNIPILLIEASPIINELQIPNSINWIGFDHYFIKDPENNTEFLNELSILKSKLVTDTQKLVIVFDAHYIPEIHNNISGISKNEMKEVATSYYNLAKTEQKVIALLGYTWPGGFDTNTALGARQLPQLVKDEYQRIGKEITNK